MRGTLAMRPPASRSRPTPNTYRRVYGAVRTEAGLAIGPGTSDGVVLMGMGEECNRLAWDRFTIRSSDRGGTREGARPQAAPAAT